MKALLPRLALPSALIVFLAACASTNTQKSSRSSSTVTAEDLVNFEHEQIEFVIQRKVPGVTATQTDMGIVLEIRGGNRTPDGRILTPLYILNDMEYTPGPQGLASLDRNSIATIRVLKGPETAIYGVRGANGVIVITTKKP